jgi:hypothetical protein
MGGELYQRLSHYVLQGPGLELQTLETQKPHNQLRHYFDDIFAIFYIMYVIVINYT